MTTTVSFSGATAEDKLAILPWNVAIEVKLSITEILVN